MKRFTGLFCLLLVCVPIAHGREKAAYGLEVTAHSGWTSGVAGFEGSLGELAGWESDFLWVPAWVAAEQDILRNHTSHAWWTGGRFWMQVNESLQVGIGYKSTEMRGGGYRYSMDDFGAFMLAEVRSREELQDVYLDVSYKLWNYEQWSLVSGGRLSFLKSDTDFSAATIYYEGLSEDRESEVPFQYLGSVGRSYWRISPMLGLNYAVSERWYVVLEYEYLRPHSHEMHLLGLRSGYRF